MDDLIINTKLPKFYLVPMEEFDLFIDDEYTLSGMTIFYTSTFSDEITIEFDHLPPNNR